MQITLDNISKRYRFEWIIKKLTYEFELGNAYAILGPNGSGKSTLMRMLSGYLSPSKGKIIFQENDAKVEIDKIFEKVSYAAPYIDLIEELSLSEAIRFHQRFKPFYENVNAETIHELLGFKKSKHKPIKFFSSGMKQRLKLVLACASAAPILLLDEPTTNLDHQGVNWYLSLIERFTENRLVVVASNIEHDYGFCNAQINIMDYK
jgi:ABC-type multidrug transport system ATPase subunit